MSEGHNIDPDLRCYLLLCIHEASHAHVARSLGCSAYWRTYPIPSSDPWQWSTWYGHTCIHGEVCAGAMRTIALAGCVGEVLWEDPDCDGSLVEDFIWVNGLTETDATNAEGYRYEDIERAIEVVRDLRKPIHLDAIRHFTARMNIEVDLSDLKWGLL